MNNELSKALGDIQNLVATPIVKTNERPPFMTNLLETIKEHIKNIKTGLSRDQCKDDYEHGHRNGMFFMLVEVRRFLNENSGVDALPFSRFEHVLRKHGLVDPCAFDDPEGFDNHRTLGSVHAAHRELISQDTNS